MGIKRDKQTAAGAELSDDLVSRLAPLGVIASKQMFGHRLIMAPLGGSPQTPN